MENQKTKKCKICSKEFPATKEYFPLCGNGRYLERMCKKCKKEYRKKLRSKRKFKQTTISYHKTWKGEVLEKIQEQILQLQKAVEIIKSISV